MTVETSVKKYRDLLARRCEAMKMQLELDMEIQVFEKEMQLRTMLAGASKSVDHSATQMFIEENRDKLDEEDIEFLQTEYRRIGEVAAYTGISESTLRRRAEAGRMAVRPREKGEDWQFSTLSVMECHLSDPQEKS